MSNFFGTHDYSLLGSSVHDIFQTRILEWLPLPIPGHLPDAGIGLLRLPHWQVLSHCVIWEALSTGDEIPKDGHWLACFPHPLHGTYHHRTSFPSWSYSCPSKRLFHMSVRPAVSSPCHMYQDRWAPWLYIHCWLPLYFRWSEVILCHAASWWIRYSIGPQIAVMNKALLADNQTLI